MPDPAIATAADYADALYTSRRAKNVLVLILLLLLITQLALFFVVRFDVIHVSAIGAAPTTQSSEFALDRLHYATGFTVFLGVTLSIVLSFVLLLIVGIMLVGRLIGVARLISAYVWCLVLIVLLFPWQAFLNDQSFSKTDFKIPGVLYTWDELRQSAHFANEFPDGFLKWARFAGFPALGVVLTLLIQMKSNRGIAQAFGETDDDERITATNSPTRAGTPA
jgi:hypothetical protein